MEDRIDGAELCHRIDAAKQLEKHKSKAAAKFLDKYRGVSCGHSINGRPNPADPCSAAERSLVAVTLNAPATLTRDFLTVLSGIDEFLMARLIRAQTADGVTVIEFLDDVMQDRNDGFKTHHRIAAAKELIVHIVRDEQPVAGSVHPEPGSPEPVERVEGSVHPELAAGSVHPEPRQIVIPAEAGTHPPDPAQGPQDHKVRRTGRRRTRTQRRRDGNARAAILGKGSERNKEEKAGQARPRGAHHRRA